MRCTVRKWFLTGVRMLEVEILDRLGERKWGRLNRLMANPMRTLERGVRGVVHDAIQRQFETEGEYGGIPWAPLADRTSEERARLGFGGENPILRRTDNLFDALTTGRMVSAGQGAEIDIDDDSFTLRTIGFPYAAALNEGRPAGPGYPAMPGRELIPVGSPDFIQRLKAIISGYVIRAELETAEE